MACCRPTNSTPSSGLPNSVAPRAWSPEALGRAIVDLELPAGVDKLNVVEAAAVAYALEVTRGNKSKAARLLGRQRQRFSRRGLPTNSRRSRHRLLCLANELRERRVELRRHLAELAHARRTAALLESAQRVRRESRSPREARHGEAGAHAQVVEASS